MLVFLLVFQPPLFSWLALEELERQDLEILKQPALTAWCKHFCSLGGFEA